MKSVFLITGLPVTGKTNLIKQLYPLREIKAGGFFTEDILLPENREGFRITSLEGKTATLSHVNF